MLEIPEKGFGRSVEAHNVELDVLCDWIEGTVLFDEVNIASTDVIDLLREEEIYVEQDMANERMQDAWAELKRRHEWIGNASPFIIESHAIQRRHEWREAAAYSFCILLSLAKAYRKWARGFGSNYTEQGEIFEELTRESLQRQFSGWEFIRTGWAPKTAKKLESVVDMIVERLGESKGDVKKWAKHHANEEGLDILCYRPFPDRRVGIPVLLLQCASGLDWEGKTDHPRTKTWSKLVQFTALPHKAFAIPFALPETEFIRICNLVDGLLIDRYRLLAADRDKANWMPATLRDRIIQWAEPRIKKLPLYAD